MSNLSYLLDHIISISYTNFLLSNNLKLYMIQKEGFSLYDCFELLNLNNDGKINYFCIKEYLKGNNYYCTDEESNLLLYICNTHYPGT